MSLLWVVPRWPLPPHDGAKLASVRLLRPLARRTKLDLLVLAEGDEVVDVAAAKAFLGVSDVLVARRASTTGRLRNINLGLSFARRPRLPVTAASFGAPAVTSQVRRLVQGRRWDGLVFEGMHAAASFSDGDLFRSPSCADSVIYRAHNVESDLWDAAARHEPSGWKRRLLGWQSTRIARFESSLARAVRAVAAISDEDSRRFRAIVPGARVATIPVGMEFPETLPAPPTKENPSFLYCGRLDWAPNRQGIEWLLREVWPEVARRHTTARLTLIGNGRHDWLDAYAGLPRLEVVGYVDSPLPYMERAAALLVPVFVGSGVRVKILEASTLGLPCISTRLGASGTSLEPGAHYLEVERPDQWIEALSTFQSDAQREKGRLAFEHLKPRLSIEKVGEAFLELLQ